MAAYEKGLAKEKEEHEKKERQSYHDLLDKSFDRMKNSFGIVDFPLYFSTQIIKQLKRSQWLRLRKKFDKFFGIL